jgi:hypothetical protein
MPLYDWVVLNKSEGRDIIRPEHTAGGKRFDNSDPETVEMLRKLYDHAQTELPDPGPPLEPNPPLTVFSRIWDLVSRGKDFRHMLHRSKLDDWRAAVENYTLWTGPFEAVLEFHANESPPKLIIPTAPDRKDAIGQFQNFTDSIYAFGFHSLLPDYNDVTYYADTKLAGYDFEIDLMLVEQPNELLAMADTLENALQAYEAADRDPDPGSVNAVQYGIRWLRFWGSHGHKLRTDVRGVIDTAEGTRFIVEAV